jgi:hypothetical protein
MAAQLVVQLIAPAVELFQELLSDHFANGGSGAPEDRAVLLEVPQQGAPQVPGVDFTSRRGQQGLPNLGEVLNGSLGRRELPVREVS